jgi:hypothetical protein
MNFHICWSFSDGNTDRYLDTEELVEKVSYIIHIVPVILSPICLRQIFELGHHHDESYPLGE